MKKIICTAIAMVTLMTSGYAANANTRNMGDLVRDGVKAQLVVHEVKCSDTWGLPMTHVRIKLFGVNNFYEGYHYDFMD